MGKLTVAGNRRVRTRLADLASAATTNAVATGGSITTDTSNLVTHTFSGAGTFVMNSNTAAIPVVYTISATGTFGSKSASGKRLVQGSLAVTVTSGTVTVSYNPADLTTNIRGLLVAQGATNYWPFQTTKAAAATEADLIGSKTMTMVGATANAITADTGPLTELDTAAIAFVASSSMRMNNTSPSFDTRQNWSVSFWVKNASAYTGNGPVFCQLDVTSGTTYIFIMHRDDQGGLVVQIGANASAAFLDPGSIQLGDNKWHHVCITRAYSATATLDTWTIFVDGTQVVQSTANAMGFTPANTSSSSNGWSFMGRTDGGTAYADGSLGYAAIAVGVTWTAAQVRAQWVRGFDPLTAIAWARAYSASGPEFLALFQADGASMNSTNWPDEISSNAAPLDAGQGTFKKADANANSQRSVQVGTSGKRHSASVAAGAQVSLPYTVVIIAYVGSTSGYIVDGANEGSSGQRVLWRMSAGPVWSLYMGTDRTGGTPATGIHVARISATSGNDVLTVDGSTIISGVDAGGGTWTGMSWTETGVVPTGQLCLWYSVYSGDLTANANWALFQTWVLATTGKSIS